MQIAGTYLINLHTRLPNETIDYGYSVLKQEVARDIAHYRSLAEQAGFQVAKAEELGRNKKAFYMDLRKSA